MKLRRHQQIAQGAEAKSQIRVDEYSLDGFIFHFTRTCKAFTLHQSVVRDAVIRQTGLPVITLEGDMVDSRLFVEGQANLVIDALIEALDTREKGTD